MATTHAARVGDDCPQLRSAYPSAQDRATTLVYAIQVKDALRDIDTQHGDPHDPSSGAKTHDRRHHVTSQPVKEGMRPSHKIDAMPFYVGLDVSQKDTEICVVDQEGRRLHFPARGPSNTSKKT
jgi:hypothetical protein